MEELVELNELLLILISVSVGEGEEEIKNQIIH
jgi:hypothetical protein